MPQSAAVFGHAGLALDDPDYIAAYVMNYVLGGGGFSSRLLQEVRVKRGLAYGVYSYLAVRNEAALYLGSVQTANERMAESEREGGAPLPSLHSGIYAPERETTIKTGVKAMTAAVLNLLDTRMSDRR